MSRPTIWAVQNLGNINLIDAEEFGDIKVILKRFYNHVQCRRAYTDMREALADVKPEDFLLPIGNPTFIAFAGAVMFEKTGRIRTLQWDRQRARYYIQEI